MKKISPIIFNTPMVQAIQAGRKKQTRRVMRHQPTMVDESGAWWKMLSGGLFLNLLKCPYGQSGDILYVRETHTVNILGHGYIYRADCGEMPILGKWTPSIHMKKVAARTFLEITRIRWERVADISEADAVAEGCAGGGTWDTAPSLQFMSLWESINGPESWAANPWVWVLDFKETSLTDIWPII